MGEKYTILVIDDALDILKVLKANLELHGFVVTTAKTWSEGQSIIRESVPNLLILDVILPDGDGIDICQSIRKQHPSLPIIMLTAKDKLLDKVIGFESGADDYVVKPFETLELIARIKACLRRIKNECEDEITIGDLNIDCKRHLVKIKGIEIPLTHKEYDLLCFLAIRKGVVVSREEIRRHLWKESKIYSWSRVIDVHIQHLRRKIEVNPAKPEYIITAPGVGYKFTE